jgi:transcriptional regulator with XRE-family HTH domain
MESTKTLGELIGDAVSKGLTRSRLAEMAGCSRMQLWRLEKGLSSAQSKAGKQLHRALDGIPEEAVENALRQLSDELDKAPPFVRHEALQMLQSVKRLLQRQRRN